MVSTKKLLNPDGGGIKREALLRSFQTLVALDRMCKGGESSKPQVEHCQFLAIVHDGVLDLTTKGFTVTEIQCNRGKVL